MYVATGCIANESRQKYCDPCQICFNCELCLQHFAYVRRQYMMLVI
jgi:hypothetical protein